MECFEWMWPMRNPAVRPVRHYEIWTDIRYSLRDAARAGDLSRKDLRRAILLGEIDAEPVDDDREYLLRGAALPDHLRALRPQEQPRFEGADDAARVVGVFLAIPLVALLLLAGLHSHPVPAVSKSLASPPPEQVESVPPLRGRTPVPPKEPAKSPRGGVSDEFPGW